MNFSPCVTPLLSTQALKYANVSRRHTTRKYRVLTTLDLQLLSWGQSVKDNSWQNIALQNNIALIKFALNSLSTIFFGGVKRFVTQKRYRTS